MRSGSTSSKDATTRTVSAKPLDGDRKDAANARSSPNSVPAMPAPNRSTTYPLTNTSSITIHRSVSTKNALPRAPAPSRHARHQARATPSSVSATRAVQVGDAPIQRSPATGSSKTAPRGPSALIHATRKIAGTSRSAATTPARARSARRALIAPRTEGRSDSPCRASSATCRATVPAATARKATRAAAAAAKKGRKDEIARTRSA